MIKQRLSEVLGAIKKGYAVDTFQGGFPVSQVIKAPDAESTTAVHAAIALTTVAQDVATGITNPDVYRALRIVGNQANVYANVTVYGNDWAGRAISETLLASGTTAAETGQAFKTVTKIHLPIKTANGQTVAFGISKKIGLYRPLAEGITSLDLLKVDGTVESEAAIDLVNDTFTATTAPNGTKNFEVAYQTEIF